MNLVFVAKDVLRKISPRLVDDFDTLTTRINGVWAVNHDPQSGGHTSLTWGGSTQTTVGAAGGASALPATPSGYLEITKDGTSYVIPYYAKS